MAGTHETYSLGINVNYGSVNKAEHALGAVYTSLGKVGERADRLHMPSALPIEINHIDTVTASYIQRLESEGRICKKLRFINPQSLNYQISKERFKMI